LLCCVALSSQQKGCAEKILKKTEGFVSELKDFVLCRFRQKVADFFRGKS